MLWLRGTHVDFFSLSAKSKKNSANDQNRAVFYSFFFSLDLSACRLDDDGETENLPLIFWPVSPWDSTSPSSREERGKTKQRRKTFHTLSTILAAPHSFRSCVTNISIQPAHLTWSQTRSGRATVLAARWPGPNPTPPPATWALPHPRGRSQWVRQPLRLGSPR